MNGKTSVELFQRAALEYYETPWAYTYTHVETFDVDLRYNETTFITKNCCFLTYRLYREPLSGARPLQRSVLEDLANTSLHGGIRPYKHI